MLLIKGIQKESVKIQCQISVRGHTIAIMNFDFQSFPVIGS